MSGAHLTVALVLGWLIVGSVVGARLTRLGHDATTSASALVAWPALLSLLSAEARAVAGPYAARIASTFQALSEALGDPVAAPVPWRADALALREVLEAADHRLVLVDRLLATTDDHDPVVARSRGALTAARAHAASEIEAVLGGLVELRLQIGMLALAGDSEPVRDRLAALQARARALAEVDALASGSNATPA